MSDNIHSTSIIDSKAVIDSSVIIGPYCIIGPNVKIKRNTILKSNVIVNGHTEIGTDCKLYPFSVLGNPPQDLKFKGEISKLIIGNNNVIREHVTMNPGTEAMSLGFQNETG
jgi:UDP-N-acetylglucosamine acyltransferase